MRANGDTSTEAGDDRRTGSVWPIVAVAFAGLLVLPALLLTRSDPATLPGLLRGAGLSAAWLSAVALVAASAPSRPTGPRGLGLRRPRVRGAAWWGVAIGGGLALSQAMDLALRLGGAGRGAALDLMLAVLGRARGGDLALALLVVGAGAGMAEELFFRGYVQRRLTARFGGVKGIAFAAALFAVAHFDPQHAAYAFVLGAFVGTIALWSDSTWPAIAVHAANNAAAILLVASGAAGLDAAASPAALATELIVALAVVAACLAWLYPRRAALDAGDDARVGSGA